MTTLRLLLVVALLAPLCAGQRATTLAPTTPEIENFQQFASTETTILLSWSLDIVQNTPLKYTLVINNFITTEFLCGTANCQRLVQGLSPCMLYSFKLKAVFNVGGTLLPNTPATTQGSTKYQVPKSVSGLTEEDGLITWRAPSNAQCVAQYEVCYSSTIVGKVVCEKVAGTTYDISDLPGCDTFKITVCGITADGQLGPKENLRLSTPIALAGTPRNLEVSLTTTNTVQIIWDNPSTNPACVAKYSITYGETNVYNPGRKISVRTSSDTRQQNHATVSDLLPCTNYTIELVTVTIDNFGSSAPAIADTATNFTKPMAIPGVTVKSEEKTILVDWGTKDDHCLGAVKVCISDFLTATGDCVVVGLEKSEVKIQGLEPCRKYNVLVSGESPIGEYGPVSVHPVHTLDVAPGIVTNLTLEAASSDSIVVYYNYPLERPECVAEYDITYVNIQEELYHVVNTHSLSLRSEFDNVLTGLQPCCTYNVSVRGVSASGQPGPWDSQQQITEKAAPGLPRNPKVIHEGRHDITLRWFTPIERYCIIYHEIKLTPLDGFNPSRYDVGYNSPYPEEIVFTTNSLEPCTTYNVTIKAVNNFFFDLAEEVLVGLATTTC